MEKYVSRRRQAMMDEETTAIAEVEEKAMAQEEKRRNKKEESKRQLEEDSSYRLCRNVAKYMDDYYLDPVLGFFLPGVGDIISQTLALPYLYVSLFKIRSIPLTLAVLYNMMIDSLVGLFPWLGDLIDIFYKSNKKSYRMIVGFVEDDEAIKHEVNSKAVRTGILIVIVGLLIYWLIQMVASFIGWIGTLFA